jgi:membrane protein DedA with SNARE-associated domain
MVIEGPFITTAVASAASLGYLNIVIIFFLSLLGDLLGDFIHYTLGRTGRTIYPKKFSLSKQKDKFGKIIKDNNIKGE